MHREMSFGSGRVSSDSKANARLRRKFRPAVTMAVELMEPRLLLSTTTPNPTSWMGSLGNGIPFGHFHAGHVQLGGGPGLQDACCWAAVPRVRSIPPRHEYGCEQCRTYRACSGGSSLGSRADRRRLECRFECDRDDCKRPGAGGGRRGGHHADQLRRRPGNRYCLRHHGPDIGDRG